MDRRKKINVWAIQAPGGYLLDGFSLTRSNAIRLHNHFQAEPKMWGQWQRDGYRVVKLTARFVPKGR